MTTQLVFHLGNEGHQDGDLVKLNVNIDGEFREVASGLYDAKNKVVIAQVDETNPQTKHLLRHMLQNSGVVAGIKEATEDAQ